MKNSRFKILVIGVCLFLVPWLLVLFIAGCGESAKEYKVGDLNLAISIHPDPPKAGDNTLKMKLKDPAGKVVKSAKINVVYGMPGMGSMSAMQSQASAKLKGDNYETVMNLSMLGSWYVRLTIEQKSQATISAEFKVSTGQKGILFVSESSAHKGMDMEEMKGPVVKLSKSQEDIAGIKAVVVEMHPLFKELRTVGVIAYDPQMVIAQEEFIAALEAGDGLAESSQRKLKILGLSDNEIAKLKATKKVDSNLLLPEKKMWVYANIYEYEMDWIKKNQHATIKSVAYPGKSFMGRIKAIEPILDAKTRSAKLRIEVQNPRLELKPQMYVDVFIKSGSKHVLAVPKAAVLDTGVRKVVYLKKSGGRYLAREVIIGSEGRVNISGKKHRFLPVLSGLKKGDLVVTSANFLIDSQSQLSGGSSALYGGATEVKSEHSQMGH